MDETQDIATLEWLTNALSKADLLEGNYVKSVTKRILTLTFFSKPKVFLLDCEISGNVPPTHLDVVLKIANGLKEYVFFSSIAPATEIAEVIRCYHAEYDHKEKQAYFLLENVTNTHYQTDWPVPPKMDQCFRAIDCLARVHAFWWNHPDLETDLIGKCNMGNHWKERIDLAIAHIPDFFDFMAGRLSKERKRIYEFVLSSRNQTWRPRQTEYGKTLLHGDAHFWNFLISSRSRGGKNSNYRLELLGYR